MTRDAHVRLHVPELLGCRTVLYVGANPARFQLYGLLAEAHARITVLEVWRPYCEALARDTRHPVARIICGDVRAAEQVFDVVREAPYDAVIWWHGPEHVPTADAAHMLRPGGMLERLAGRLVLLGAPWGTFAQGAVDGNPAQAHASTWLPADFEAFGYRTATMGARDHRGHITAWKVLP